MFDIRLREYTPAGVKGRVLETAEVRFTHAESATSTVTFQTSARVADRMEAPFVVGVEYSTGGAWQRPRNDLFVVLRDAEDAADQTGVMQFTAQSYLGWLLQYALLWWAAGGGDKRAFSLSPGAFLKQLITEAQGTFNTVVRGWAPMLTTDFTATADSLGVAWTADDKIEMEFPVWRSYSSIISPLVDQGYFEWWTEGTMLRVARAGTGVDRAESVVLGGPSFSSAPAKTDFDGTATRMVLIPDGPRNIHTENAGADTRFGALETSMTLAGVEGVDKAIRQAQPHLVESRSKKLELSYDWSPAAGGPIPWAGFNVGDLVTARRKTGKQPQRVIGLQVSKSGSVVSARAIVGSKLVGMQAKLAKRVGSVSQGTVIGGSGAAFPSTTGPASLVPAAPGAVRVESNTAVWADDGTAVSTVTVAWDAVTTDVDGNGLTITRYEVGSRTASGALQTDTATGDLSARISRWTAGESRYVAVRAQSAAGVWSEWSDQVAVVPAMPASIVPKAPTGLTVVSNVGAFASDGRAVATVTVGWNPVTQSVENTGVEIQEYEVTVGLESFRVTGVTGSFTLPSGASGQVTVRARTTLNIWGDPSAALAVVGALPQVVAYTPSTPVLTSGMGGVTYKSDGLPARPNGFGHLVVDTAPAAAGPWSPTGTPLTDVGGGALSIDVGTAVFVRFRAFDTLGRLMGTSAVASATAAGISIDDIPGIVDDLEAIQHTADGKNRVYLSATVPVSDTGNLIPNGAFRTDLSGWTTQGNAGAVSSLSRSETGGPDGLPYATLTLDTAGTGGSFYWRAYSDWFPIEGGLPYTASAELRGSGVGRMYIQWRLDTGGASAVGASPTLPVAWGERTALTGTAPAGAVQAQVIIGRVDATGPLDFTGVQLEQSDTASEFVEAFAQGDLWLRLDETGASVMQILVWNGSAWAPQVLLAQDIVAAGSITGVLIGAETLTVNHVVPTFGDDLNIAANESVTIIVGRQEEQATELSTVQDDIVTVESAASAAANAAGAAAGTANAAKTAAANAAATAAATAAALAKHQTYYRFGTTGLAIGDPGSAAELRLEPDRIAMTQNNVVVSYWEGGVFAADEVRLASAEIGNHRWEKYGPGRTIARPL